MCPVLLLLINMQKYQSEKDHKEYEEKGLSKLLVDEDIFLMHLIFKNQESQEKNKGLKHKICFIKY